VLSAFQEALQSGGGELLAQERIAASDPAARELASSIQGALRIGQSLARHRQLQSELNTPLAFQPRRRGDVDFLFVPASSRLLRQVRPQLRFQAVADIPTYSVSSAWNGTADEELGNLQFVDMPWMISGADTENVTLRTEAQQSFGAGVLQSRLFAMGHDAWLLSTVMLSGSTSQGPPLNDPILGLTGELRVGADGRIARSLEWATLNRRGELILRDQMDDQSTDDLRE
jgi:outer membrane PBP1 activator LpoA protein